MTVGHAVNRTEARRPGLLAEMVSTLALDCHCHRTDAGDPERARSRLVRRVRNTLLDAIGAFLGGATPRVSRQGLEDALGRRRYVLENADRLDWLHGRLADEHSRRLLRDLVHSWLLGAHGRTPPTSASADSQELARINRELRVARSTRQPWQPSINRYRLQGVTGHIALDARQRDVLETFVLEQYAYRQGGTEIHVQAGDVVIDGGAGVGGAALYFADRVGSNGHVYAVDIAACHGSAMARNIALNPHLSGRVSVVHRGLTDRSGDVISYRPDGSATSLIRVDPLGTIMADTPTVAIDDLVQEREIRRVDFIRLDIGGFERRALHGARDTIAKSRPALAVVLSHQDEDLTSIPIYLDSVASDYELFLNRCASVDGKLLLFARPNLRRSTT